MRRIEHICTFFVGFFSGTIDGRNLIFGHKLHIGTLYRGKRFLTRQIPRFLPSTVTEKNATKISWTDGRTDRWTEVKQYIPLPLRGAGVYKYNQVPRINFQKSVIFAKKKYIFCPKMKKFFKYCFLKLCKRNCICKKCSLLDIFFIEILSS
jgi:hypothetical protein